MICLSAPAAALLISVVGGVPVTWVWTRSLHRRLAIKYPKEFSDRHSDPLTSAIIGVLERGTVTMLVIWLPQDGGAIAAAILAIKAAGSWSLEGSATVAGRVRYFTAFLGGLGSILWAIAWGIWAK